MYEHRRAILLLSAVGVTTTAIIALLNLYSRSTSTQTASASDSVSDSASAAKSASVFSSFFMKRGSCPDGFKVAQVVVDVILDRSSTNRRSDTASVTLRADVHANVDPCFSCRLFPALPVLQEIGRNAIQLAAWCC